MKKKKEDIMSRITYAHAVGSGFMYAILCTRPSFCFAVGLVSRYQSNPGQAHWQAVQRVLRYMKGSKHFML
jgi:hypothetical protein